ncbi:MULTISPECIES: LytR/AlgR family response regulator transcription factor [Flavobacterium]|uniref:Response regulator transcription factor n=1 Tax=Flavobacterium hankyongi TaxID=1176532 RepID=A0ABP8ZT36_9FLAO|nr:LytTR family transcriptional regulator DNA-binding domain-containing protein [Flavobacterium sp. N1846]
MSYKIALLDDNPEQLQSNCNYLKSVDSTIVVIACTSAKTFMEEVKLSKPDVLVLDLNLGDSYMTGMEVAYELKLPVLFASSNVPQYIKEIETLKREYGVCVEHITKPFTEDAFIKTMHRFLKEIQFFGAIDYVHLHLGKKGRTKIATNSIVFLSSDKENGSESNNKMVHFTHQKPEKLIDFSFTRMEEIGLQKSQFVTIHKSYRVNKHHIKSFDKKRETLAVEIFDGVQNSTVVKHLPVSENYISALKKILK